MAKLRRGGRAHPPHTGFGDTPYPTPPWFHRDVDAPRAPHMHRACRGSAGARGPGGGGRGAAGGPVPGGGRAALDPCQCLYLEVLRAPFPYGTNICCSLRLYRYRRPQTRPEAAARGAQPPVSPPRRGVHPRVVGCAAVPQFPSRRWCRRRPLLRGSVRPLVRTPVRHGVLCAPMGAASLAPHPSLVGVYSAGGGSKGGRPGRPVAWGCRGGGPAPSAAF